MKLSVVSSFAPAGGQPQAIEKITQNIFGGVKDQVLLGITGSGKTFTIAKIIERINRTTLVLSHNKTLASQLYVELKALFPNNRVEYFVSNFDYYRPEAYLPRTDTYIAKTSQSNWNLEAMRMSAFNALSTRKDTIVVASVAAIYGALRPETYRHAFLPLSTQTPVNRQKLLARLVQMNYRRNQIEPKPATFRVRGDVVEVTPGWTDEYRLRIAMEDEEISDLVRVDPLSGEVVQRHDNFTIFPGNAYSVDLDTVQSCLAGIRAELPQRIKYFKEHNKLLEAQRLEERVRYDLETLQEFGTCSGIENYARYMDKRQPGEAPFTLLDYLPNDTVFILDESHILLPQLHGMYKADRSRKQSLVDYGFRLPSALDNRPLRFNEFMARKNQKVYLSATPAQYEVDKSAGVVTELIIRPTGLLDPSVEVCPKQNQIENIIDRIKKQVSVNERTLVVTTTIRMAEELTRFLQGKNIKATFLHNELKTLQRTSILRKLRLGTIDVVVGINLLKEGIDLPEVSLMLVLDADFESFFRSTTALIQLIGRVARNVHGHVVLYADRVTPAMRTAMDLTATRRKQQIAFNKKHNITPKTVKKPVPPPINVEGKNKVLSKLIANKKVTNKNKERLVKDLRRQMLLASKQLNFERAAQLRDVIVDLENEG